MVDWQSLIEEFAPLYLQGQIKFQSRRRFECANAMASRAEYRYFKAFWGGRVALMKISDHESRVYPQRGRCQSLERTQCRIIFSSKAPQAEPTDSSTSRLKAGCSDVTPTITHATPYAQ